MKLKNITYKPKVCAKRIVAAVLCGAMVLSFAACSEKPADSNQKKSDVKSEFNKFCDELFVESIESDALTAHFKISNPSDYGIEFDEEDYTLGDPSISETEEAIDSMKEDLANLREFDRSKLTENQQITYDTLEDYLEVNISYSGTELVQTIFAPSMGLMANLSNVFTEYVFYEKEDVNQYLMFLKDTRRYVKECINIVKMQSEKGYFMSDKTADEAIEECKKHYEGKGKDIIAAFEEKLDALKISEGEKKSFTKTLKEYLNKYYLPSFKDVSYVLTSLKGTGKNDGGLCNYGKLGKKYYKALLRDKTSSDITPEEAIELIENSMKDLVADIVNISFDDYNEALEYQPDFNSSEEIVEFLIDNIEKDFPAPVTTNYNIQNMDETSENDMTAAYYVGCRIDDISVNNIKVNSSSVDNTLTLYTTLAHEAYPGHLYESTRFYSDESIPDVRKILDFIGSTEGWAQYAGNCAVQYLDASDGVKTLVNLNEMLSFLLMARSDIGVNYEGWDIDDVYDYLKSYIAVDDNYDSEENIPAQFFDSAVSNAGAYIPYALGYVKMLNMREKAEEELGKKFSTVEYNDFLCSVGITSFDVYEQQLDAWIEDKK